MGLPSIKTLEELVDFYRYWPGSRPVPVGLMYSPHSPGATPVLSELSHERRQWLYARLKDLQRADVKPGVIEQTAKQLALGLHRREMHEKGYFDEDFRFVEDWDLTEHTKDLVVGWRAQGLVGIEPTKEKSQDSPESTDSKADGTEP